MNPSILLADDHVLVLEAISRMLRRAFTVVGIAANGREVVAAARRLQPDAVMMDVSLPILNGLDAGQQHATTDAEAMGQAQRQLGTVLRSLYQ